MTRHQSETELARLKKAALASAKSRRERVTSAHLLAVMAGEHGPAARLLTERGLTADRLLRAARASTDEDDDPLREALDRAREVASRMRAPNADAVHLLVALLSHRGFAAHRALDQCGVDISRLRVAAMNSGLGSLGRRPISTRRDSVSPGSSAEARSSAPGTTVPLVPKPSVRPRARAALIERGDASSQAALPNPSRRSLPPPDTAEKPRKRGKSRFKLDKRKFPTLTALGRNLSLAAEQGELDPVVGRDAEVQQALDVLGKRHGNNPCLVGPAGVGKTSVVRAMALTVADSDDVEDKILIEVPVAELFAGTGVRGALASRLGSLKTEVAASGGRVVLFFDEIHQLFRADAGDEIAGELKLLLARGELPCIGATTREEFQKAISADPALERRFSVVEVDEPCRADAFLMLDALAERLREHHQVEFTEEALALAVSWTVQYVQGRALPDKALSVVDLAGARARRRGGARIGAEEIAEVVSEMADVPIERLLETDGERMLRLEALMAERVVGHEDKLEQVAKIIRRNAVGLGGKRPIGTFLLLGPTGVGKTETAKAIAEALFFSESAMTRLDMSEFSEPHSVARLIGAPPGYIGHDAGGQLTEAVRRRPYQVLLLDEIEKAHPEVIETFLAVFDEGRLTDSAGKLVDFTNTVILLTSNIGAQRMSEGPARRVGFGVARSDVAASLDRKVADEARARLSPELYNRIDEVLVYRPLGRTDVESIARRMIERLAACMQSGRGIGVRVTRSAVGFLMDNGGFEPELGARPMKRALARFVEAPLAEAILRGEITEGMTACITVDHGEVVVRPEPSLDSTAAE